MVLNVHEFFHPIKNHNLTLNLSISMILLLVKHMLIFLFLETCEYIYELI